MLIFEVLQGQNAEQEVKELIQNSNNKVLSKLFLKRLEFGTAGLRGRMGPGYSQMNDLVIVQTGQGLSKYILDTNATKRSIIIGYDGRYCSKRLIRIFNNYTVVIIEFVQQMYLYTTKILPTSLQVCRTNCCNFCGKECESISFFKSCANSIYTLWCIKI